MTSPEIAVLQEQQKNTEEKVDHLHEKVDELSTNLVKLSTDVQKRASFIAGVTTAVSVLWATALGAVYLIFRFKGNI